MPFIDINKLLTGERLPGWKGRSFNSETMTFAHYCFDAGSKIHEHCHSNEEVWTVIEGTLEVSVGAESLVAGPGCVAIVPGNTAHSVRAVTDGKAIVTDCPVRLDPSGGRRAVVEILFDGPLPLPQDPAGSAIETRFTLHNWGKTRAVVRELRIESKIAAALPPAATTEIPGGDLPVHCVLEPDERHAATVSQPALTREDLQQVLDGTAVFYAKGVIFYDDDFGARHHTTFCRVYDRGAFDGKGGLVAPDRPGYNYGT